MSSTETDTLAKKSTAEDVISGGHLVAKALKNKGVNSSGKSAVINIWVDPDEYAPGTKAQTMYK